MANATATMPRPISGGDQITLEYGKAEVFALRFTSGKSVPSKYPGGRVMFSSVDRGALFLNDEDAGDLEISLRKLGVEPGDLIRVMKVKMPHGGGHALRVERVSDAAEPPPTSRAQFAEPPSRMESLLEKSIEMARGRTAYEHEPRFTEPVQRSATPVAPVTAKPLTATHAKFLSAYMVAIDIIAEARVYLGRTDLPVDVVTFGDIRALAATIIIDQQGGR